MINGLDQRQLARAPQEPMKSRATYLVVDTDQDIQLPIELALTIDEETCEYRN